MSKIKSLAFAAIGAAGIYYGIQNHNNRFSDEAIWARQRPYIEMAARTHTIRDADARFAALRTSLDSTTLKTANRETRCRFDTDFRAATVSGENSARATAILQRASYDPYHHCTNNEQMKASDVSVPVIGGGIVAVIGVLSFLASCWSSFSSWRRERREERRARGTAPAEDFDA